ncbi:hypothetical protein RUM43_010235 [Polyplax serrata]|uniref:FAM192A/Fyv6 N-terminal domain-containing protein n=1 Tax=Polyplax serrata TaxID=468196 RepID=A0AAN8P033_POLSC
MNVDNSCGIQCTSLSLLDSAVDNVVQVLLNNEEEVQKFNEKKQSLDSDMERKKKYMQQLDVEKSEIDAQITTLRLRNAAYQREHTNLRNAITVVKYQIENIKESIGKAKARELEELEEFEKSVDEITEKFRSGPENYDRRSLMERLKEEKEKKNELTEKMEELTNSYLELSKKMGLRARWDEKEDLIDCVLPGSKLFDLMEMTKNLDDVVYVGRSESFEFVKIPTGKTIRVVVAVVGHGEHTDGTTFSFQLRN